MREPSALRLWSRRAARRRALLAVIALAVAVLAGLAVVATTFAVRAPTLTARAALHDTPASDATVRITATGDPTTQDAAFRQLVRRAFGSAPASVTRTVDGSRTTWVVAPRTDELRASELGDLEHGFRTLPDRAAIRFGTDNGTVTRGSGVSTATTLHRSVDAVTAVIPVPMTLLAVSGAVALGMLGRLLVTARTAEDRLLRARGASGRQLVRIAVAESGVVGAIGVVVGGAVGTAAVWPMYGPPSGPAEVVVPLLAVLVLAVGAVSIAALSGVAQRIEATSTRTTVAVSGAVVLLLLAIAAVAVWRYRDPSASASTRATDPLAIIAPAAALTALGVTAAVLLGPLLALVARGAARSTGLVRPLAARLAARDVRVLATPVTLLTLAVAAGALAAGSNGTTTAFLHDSGRIAHGSAVRATIGGSVPLNGPSDLVPADLRSASSERAGIAPALRFTGTTPTANATVIGTDAHALAALQPVAPELFDATATAHALTAARSNGLALGTGGQPLSFRVALSAGAASVTTYAFDGTSTTTTGPGSATLALTAWVADAQGDLAPLDTDDTVLASSSTQDAELHADLPDGGPWRLVALDVRSRSSADLADVGVRVTGIDVGGRATGLPSGAWTIAPGAFDDAGFGTGSAAIGATTSTLPGLGSTVAGVRLMPPGDRTVPIAVGADLARSAGLHVGDAFDVTGSWAGFRARVVAVVPVVPGTTANGILADLATLDRGMLADAQRPARVREVWAAAETSRAVLAEALPAASLSTPSTATESRFVSLSTDTLLLGVGGGVLFAVLALAAAVVTIGRERADEARGLRAVGVRARTQALARAFGPTASVVHAVVAGLVAGLGTFLLVVPTTARTSAPSAPAALPVHDAFDPALLGVVLGAVVAAGIVVVLVQSVRIRAESRRAGAGVDA